MARYYRWLTLTGPALACAVLGGALADAGGACRLAEKRARRDRPFSCFLPASVLLLTMNPHLGASARSLQDWLLLGSGRHEQANNSGKNCHRGGKFECLVRLY